MSRLPVAITIAGVDSSGGAGIAADLKTFASLGVHGALAVTSVTAQNTVKVTDIHDVPPETVRDQIIAVAEDLGIDAGKTGMLSNREIIKAVVKSVKEVGFPLVVDPVMIAKSGAKLLRDEAISELRNSLIPLATVVTPNAPEATVLTGIEVKDLGSAREAAEAIVEELGAEAAVVKGGHLSGSESIDILYFRGEFKEFKAPRVNTSSTHGTGCSFSAAIAAELAKRKSIPEAVAVAKSFITKAIVYGLKLGKGHGPVNPVAEVALPAGRWEVIQELRSASKYLLDNGRFVNAVMPEVFINLGMALPKPYARSVDDVAAFPGRIGRYRDTIVFKSPPEFGVSSHIASAILTAMEFDPRLRAAANIVYDRSVEEAVKELGLRWSYFDRKEEPPDVKAVEGGTTPWGIRSAVRRSGGIVPDVIFDYGEYGKEPLTLVFGKTAMEVARKVVTIGKKVFEARLKRIS
jgi:hydroxymethylpyrimidine kinase/phosphomethylpyrimidine kinase